LPMAAHISASGICARRWETLRHKLRAFPSEVCEDVVMCYFPNRKLEPAEAFARGRVNVLVAGQREASASPTKERAGEETLGRTPTSQWQTCLQTGLVGERTVTVGELRAGNVDAAQKNVGGWWVRSTMQPHSARVRGTRAAFLRSCSRDSSCCRGRYV
jgi:hypothetical protein